MLYSVRAVPLFTIFFSLNAFYLNEKLPPFHIHHILWFRECRCLLSSLLALCQEPRNFFTLLHAPRQYHSRLSFKRPKRTGRNLVAGELEWGCAWMGRLNVRHSLLGLEDHLKERGCSENVRATTPGKARPKKKMHRFGLILKCLPTETDYTSCFKQMLFICSNVWISWRKRQIRPAARMNKTSHRINETGCREGSYLTTTALGKMRF